VAIFGIISWVNVVHPFRQILNVTANSPPMAPFLGGGGARQGSTLEEYLRHSSSGIGEIRERNLGEAKPSFDYLGATLHALINRVGIESRNFAEMGLMHSRRTTSTVPGKEARTMSFSAEAKSLPEG
jgi:hypothetical protein